MKQLRWKDFSLVSKIVIEVGMIAVLLFAMNMLFYVRINNSMQKMDNVYASNAELTELSQVFEKVQDNMYKYLKVKNSQTLLDYYQNEAKYRNELEKLNEDNINDPVKLLERNIRKMSETYLDCTAETVAAKRGRNVEQYKRKYDDATKLYRYIQSSIDELNNLMFQENSSTYAVLRAVMRYLEISNSVIMIIIVAGGMLLLIQATRNMFVPLSNMAETAQLVGQGNFHVKMHDTDAQDELGTVTRAFNTMVENLDLYMARTKASMEKEQQMMERELLMENHLKEAQLKYLQSQINPHFLFNSLNAGAQLAMMGDADNTGIFLEKMADFFRYNVRKMEEDAMLWEEIGAVDNYIYILNVRFAGDITYIKEVDEGIDNIRIPSMILQPLVENAVQHGIHDCMETGWIRMEIHRNGEMLDVTVSDNGAGMTEEMIARVMAGRADQNEEDRFSTGIAVRNVIDRLQLYYKEENLFTIESDGPGKGTRVHIILPVYKDELE